MATTERERHIDQREIRLKLTVVSDTLLYGAFTPVVWVLNILTVVH
jgi:hypothetical protein